LDTLGLLDRELSFCLAMPFNSRFEVFGSQRKSALCLAGVARANFTRDAAAQIVDARVFVTGKTGGEGWHNSIFLVQVESQYRSEVPP
jgi:hypothetical protein